MPHDCIWKIDDVTGQFELDQSKPGRPNFLGT
jgi:hypothetical protein